MKTHLFLPGEVKTFCGIEIKSFSTRDPLKITCLRCLGAYSKSIDWYWYHLGQPVPPGARYSNKDVPIPGLYLSLKRGIYHVQVSGS